MRALFVALFFSYQLAWSNDSAIVVALSSKPINLSPFFSTDANSQNINRLIHLSLIDFDRKMKPKCRLCESFTESFTNGGHQIHFKLKKGIEFWDGQEIKSQDIANSLALFQTENSAIKSIFRFAFSKIKKVKIVDDFQVTLEYEGFDLENISNLVLFKILKLQKSLSQYKRVELSHIVGGGEYKLGKVNPFDITLEPLDKKRPLLVFKIVKDETTLALKFINKEIDLSVSSISPRKLYWIKKELSSSVRTFENASTNYRYIAFNHKKNIFKNREVRRALSLLIPREDILKYKLKGDADLSFGVLSKAFKNEYYEKPIDRYNPDEANRILDSAGLTRDEDGIRFQVDWKSTNNRFALEIVEVIKSYYLKAGILVSVTTQEWGTFMKSIKTGNYDMYINQWVGFTDLSILRYVFHSDSFHPKGGNRGYYVNLDLDEALNKATKETVTIRRNQYYREAQKIIAEDYPYIDLWHPKVIWLARSCISIIEPYPTGNFIPLLDARKTCHKD